MLVLSRKVGESVTLEIAGRKIVVTLEGASGKRVSLGFEAPQDVKILRTELVGQPALPPRRKTGRGRTK